VVGQIGGQFVERAIDRLGMLAPSEQNFEVSASRSAGKRGLRSLSSFSGRCDPTTPYDVHEDGKLAELGDGWPNLVMTDVAWPQTKARSIPEGAA
jgi:hypothetical protein